MRAPLAKSGGGVNGDPRNTDYFANDPSLIPFYYYYYYYLYVLRSSFGKLDDLSSISSFLFFVAIRFRVRFFEPRS